MPSEFEVTGRIVQGHPMRAVPKKDDAGIPIKGADGAVRMIRQFSLAIPAADFITNAWPAMHAEATSAFPNALQMPKFAWKYKRDTDVDVKGVPYSSREGYAGNITLSISSELDTPPPLYRQLPNGTFQQMGTDEIKCGDYCFVRINCKAQVPKLATHTPSLYINPAVIIFVGYGSEITSGQIDPNDVFKGRTFTMPPGASAMPVAPSMAASMPAQQPQPGHPITPGYAQPATQAPMAPAGMPVQPAHGFVANAGMSGMQQPQQPGALPGFPMPGR